MNDITTKIADDMPPLSHLQCDKCNHRQDVGDVSNRFRNGWPMHCGLTMRLVTVKEAGILTNRGGGDMEDECCEYHDNLLQAWDDAGKQAPTDLDDCGMAGRGLQIVCCDNCPDITRPHQTIKQVIEA